ncbi:hypothetical protein SaSA201_1527 [Streptococcus agalactiae]|nr:hypothetical protein SaSA30_1530 [Streptococcus agalactiae]AUO87510.1 hypothetical protein SaSA1_1531 [Streptococcus agalactiae]AUO89165.1 hypothetical protein SaSA5_1528 [Streptococcus agalactiae]AUP08691.1 hypothetical protein SaSA159_1524 [Streptococcus agalactiae]AUP10285.1 hypothetical protein SaSA184_1529 [Streptococcus agalactiae]
MKGTRKSIFFLFESGKFIAIFLEKDIIIVLKDFCTYVQVNLFTLVRGIPKIKYLRFS